MRPKSIEVNKSNRPKKNKKRTEVQIPRSQLLPAEGTGARVQFINNTSFIPKTRIRPGISNTGQSQVGPRFRPRSQRILTRVGRKLGLFDLSSAERCWLVLLLVLADDEAPISVFLCYPGSTFHNVAWPRTNLGSTLLKTLGPFHTEVWPGLTRQ